MLKIEKIANNINVTEIVENKFITKYVVEPLYRGYGNTVGNALRRVLLSSIPGSAVKAVRIDGVLNEFSAVDGIKEAVTDIILNIKELVIKTDTPGEKRMVLNVKGPKVVTGADILPDPEIEIINPDQVIATITTDRELNIEFLVDTGEGFVVAEDIDRTGWPIDYIAVDAIYTPIRKVSYKIEDTMVGRMTDFDKLTLTVETDGSVDTKDAISYAVELLEMHFNSLLDIGNKMEHLREPIDIEEDVVEEEIDERINMKIDELDLTVRSYNCLKKAGIESVGELSNLGLNELLKIKNLGRKSLDEIIEKMKELGYDLTANSAD
ncbi:DNA-directed RNA polymerase subunit alpha [Hypnocyclicus thermotrophus]|uniref:DNA-directed RNA polymerase subunit alpha n=1 Tax=Hypnocyclicus thermotrophus TaxID=1627895 RepID=A0AA46DYU0_9FUSO|nr:DNA-directed RNA polymerase subunit alpha [Hypnocyclicus thermotrophus]TDT70651.1 DNA-directed RNA polymerase subunit alpha [Hypnocyclicus thermotrophus]